MRKLIQPLIFALLQTWLMSISSAQALDAEEVTRSNWVGLSLSGNHVQFKDYLLSKLKNQGMITGGRLFYEHNGIKSMQRVNLNFGNGGGVKNRYGVSTLVRNWSYNYSYARKISGFKNGRGACFLGGLINGGSNGYFSEMLDEDHFYWLTSYDLGLYGIVDYRIGERNQLSVGLNLPVISLISRPPRYRYYKSDKFDFSYILDKVHEDFEFSAFNTYTAVRFEFNDTFDISSRVKERISYQLRYDRFKHPETITMISHSVGLSLIYGF